MAPRRIFNQRAVRSVRSSTKPRRHANSMWEALLIAYGGYLGLVVVIGVIGAVKDRSKRHPSLCPHGINAANNRCPECAGTKEREQKEYERRRDFRSASDKMRESERKRLSDCLSPNLDDLLKLSPRQFEDAVAQMFERLGYSVKQTPYINDQGRDAILHKDGSKMLVECKRYRDGNTVGRPEIQKFHSAIIVDDATKGFFVTTAKFTTGALRHVKEGNLPIELVDAEQLLRYMIDSRRGRLEDDNYQALCLECGESVYHSIRSSAERHCSSGHPVPPTLTMNDVLFDLGAHPRCEKCGNPMILRESRMRQGRHRRFWRCPQCRFSERPYQWKTKD